MAYLYKIDEDFDIDSFIKNSNFNIKNIIIQVMVFINNEKNYAIHYYINSNKDKDLGKNLGANTFTPDNPKISLYPRQSMLLHIFSAYIIKFYNPSIQYI
jgi:hypothetical protein